jgi:hypothetical protein
MDTNDVKDVVRKYRAGTLEKSDLAREINRLSTSISFRSIEKVLRMQYPSAEFRLQRSAIEVKKLCPTESCLEKAKYDLVRLLFESCETFGETDNSFFEGHPISGLRLSGGRFAILDGHHRVRRAYELGGDAFLITATLVFTRAFQVLQNYEAQLEEVERRIGSNHVKDMKLCG